MRPRRTASADGGDWVLFATGVVVGRYREDVEAQHEVGEREEAWDQPRRDDSHLGRTYEFYDGIELAYERALRAKPRGGKTGLFLCRLWRRVS